MCDPDDAASLPWESSAAVPAAARADVHAFVDALAGRRLWKLDRRRLPAAGSLGLLNVGNACWLGIVHALRAVSRFADTIILRTSPMGDELGKLFDALDDYIQWPWKSWEWGDSGSLAPSPTVVEGLDLILSAFDNGSDVGRELRAPFVHTRRHGYGCILCRRPIVFDAPQL
eukprot:gene29328-26362_t